MVVQSVLFSKAKWTLPNAKRWLVYHGYKIFKVDITDNFFRFRQVNPDPNRKIRNILIGDGIELIVMF